MPSYPEMPILGMHDAIPRSPQRPKMRLASWSACGDAGAPDGAFLQGCLFRVYIGQFLKMGAGGGFRA